MRACCTKNAGTWNPASLPDIVGSVDNSSGGVKSQMFGAPFDAFGAFSQITESRYSSDDSMTRAALCSILYFNASKSNSVYGASNTVLPESINQSLVIYLGR